MECIVEVGNGTASVIVEMGFDFTRDNSSKCAMRS